jgi:N-acetyl-1-D-myo-inositol-2-amino-2-deoxy-alpha-D-glucopyranoside deacetylase
MTPLLALLAVLAHPDDESFGMGGTLALYASRGVAVHLVCATRGEVGEVGPEYLQEYASIGELREAELRCAAGHLGLSGVHFLGYRDSGMAGSQENGHPQALAAQPVEEVAARVAHYIRELRPQVVVTFDPIGGYHHPDHVAIHKATVLAFEMVCNDDLYRRPGGASVPDFNRPQKLYFHTISRRFIRVIVRLLPLFGRDPHRWGKNGDIDLTVMSVDDFPIHAVIDYSSVAERKVAAAACHASQGGMSLSMGRFSWLFRLLVSNRDHFMRTVPPPGKGRRERDLFAGIT